jgi:hypothetical protein
LLLQVIRHASLEPLALQFGGGQQLAYIVVQLSAEAVTFVFLDFQEAISEFLRLKFYRFA